MSKILSPPLQRKSWSWDIGGFFPFRGNSIFFDFLLDKFSNSIYLSNSIYMYYSLDKRIWFTIIFLPLKESLTLFQIWIFFIIPLLILSQLDLLRIELPKLTPSILMKSCEHSICPAWSILFLYAPALKACLWKN